MNTQCIPTAPANNNGHGMTIRKLRGAEKFKMLDWVRANGQRLSDSRIGRDGIAKEASKVLGREVGFSAIEKVFTYCGITVASPTRGHSANLIHRKRGDPSPWVIALADQVKVLTDEWGRKPEPPFQALVDRIEEMRKRQEPAAAGEDRHAKLPF